MKIILSFLFCLISLSLFAQDITDQATGLSFPREVSFKHDGKEYHLHATGVATRKKFFLKIYSVASYVQDGAVSSSPDKFQIFLDDNNAKQLTLKFVRGLYASEVKNAYEEAFKNAVPQTEYKQLHGDLIKFLQFIDKDVNSGDVYVMRWLPGGYVEVIINDKPAGNLTNAEFAKGLWSIYFGPNSVVNRKDLISLMK